MWRKQKSPCLLFEGEDALETVIKALLEQGYVKNRPFLTALPRQNEIASFRRHFRSGKKDRQVHVQIVTLSEGGEDDIQLGDLEDALPLFGVYAHTEPAVNRPLKHLFAAFRDKMCFKSGSRVLKQDLKHILENVESAQ